MAERGRNADWPREIPANGWKDIAFRIKREVGEDRVGFIAAAVAFYMLFGLVPALGAFIAIYGLVAEPTDVVEHLETLRGILPDDVIGLVDSELLRVAGDQTAAGIGVVVSILLALWGGAKALDAVITAMNVAYEETETRNFFLRKFVSVALTFASILFLCLAAGLMGVIPAVLALVRLGSTVESFLAFARWPMLFALSILWLAVIYRYGPCRSKPKWRWVTWGAFVATLIWVAGSVGFSFYAENFGNYSTSYGSLGGILILMMWFYISGFAVMLGAEINSEIEHQTTVDSTTGIGKPRGERGAYVADHVGASTNSD